MSKKADHTLGLLKRLDQAVLVRSNEPAIE
jgi:hypothetical protein